MSNTSRARITIAHSLLIAALFAGCFGEKSPRAPAELPSFHQAPVILISIDTLRSDHLPAYGYAGVETPNLDEFRRESVLFRRAYSHSPMTLPSHGSMLTGLLPGRHGLRNNVGYSLDTSKTPYLPCTLKENGYSSGAAVSTFVLRAESGLNSCFEMYDDTTGVRADHAFTEQQRAGDVTAAIAKPWLDEHRDTSFFFFLHIYEPHAPYHPPEPFRSRYREAYDGEIAAADAIVGDFLAHLKSIGVYDRAIIIVTSDHGEGLRDHGEDQHSILLYREAIQVPLFVRLPGAARGGTTVESTAQLADLTPTILGLLQIETPQKFDGRNLFGADSAEAKVFSETLYPRIHLAWNDLASLVEGRYHYIHGPKPELYNLAADPGETKNLAADERRVAAAMRSSMAPLLVPMPRLDEVDPEVARNLASLGYIGSSRADATSVLPNPRDEISSLERLRDALLLARGESVDAAIAGVEKILNEHPKMMEGWNQLGGLYARAGKHERAAASYERAISLAPFPASDLMIEAGYAHLRAGQFSKAESLARLALEDVPEKAHQLIAKIDIATGKLREAESEARAAVAARPSSPLALVLLAETQQKQGRFDGALRTLESAQRLAESRRTGAVFGLEFLRGDTLARMGQSATAAEAYRRELATFPENLEAWGALCVLQFVSGRPDEVEKTLEAMVTANPTRRAHLYAAKTLDALENPRAAARWRQRAEQLR